MAEGEFTKRKIAFASEAALTESNYICRCVVFGTVDDAEILVASHLQSGLNKSLLAAGNERARLDHHPFATITGQILPPSDCISDGVLIAERNRAPLRARYDAARGGG